MLSDSLLIIFISVFTALLSEGLSWVLIYRTENYKRLQVQVEKQSKKCISLIIEFVFWIIQILNIVFCIYKVEKQKETISELADKNHRKKLERQEEKLKTNNRELSMVKMKSMMAISFVFMALLSMFNSM
jgi:calcium load-activated calcium channel